MDDEWGEVTFPAAYRFYTRAYICVHKRQAH